jgi:hypothetical protein
MTQNMAAKIYIASMNMRGKWAQPIDPNSMRINVTSAQATASIDRNTFSPMTQIPDTYEGFWNFESYWHSGKVLNALYCILTNTNVFYTLLIKIKTPIFCNFLIYVYGLKLLVDRRTMEDHLRVIQYK